jgi:hypothetical protein
MTAPCLPPVRDGRAALPRGEPSAPPLAETFAARGATLRYSPRGAPRRGQENA